MTNSDDVSGAPAVQITADGVTFQNSGKLVSTSTSVGAIAISGAGATIVNEAGGTINDDGYPNGNTRWPSIQGSAFDDTVINEGNIGGDVYLGEGNDTFVNRSVDQVIVHLEGGDDTYRVETESEYLLPHFIDGGDGYDRFVVGNGVGDVRASISGIEELDVDSRPGGGASLNGFSGLSAVILAPDGSYDFMNSRNPNVDVQLNGGRLIVGVQSEFRDVSGGEGRDSVILEHGTVRNVSLGGGDDQFEYNGMLQMYASHPPLVSGVVDGGSGVDWLTIRFKAAVSLDLANFTGFEVLNAGAWDPDPSDVRLVHADNYQRILSDGGGGKLTLADSSSPGARLELASQTTVVLESLVTLGSVDGQSNGASTAWAHITNDGVIVADVKLGGGDDQFDSSNGVVGGSIYGNGGNDTLLMGGGSNRIFGGLGNDFIRGGAGDDTIDGGAGLDSAAFSDVLSNYTVVATASGVTVTHNSGGSDGVDTLTGVETLVFADGIVTSQGVGSTLAERETIVYQLPADVANITGFSDTGQGLRGNGLSNVITSGSGADFIDARDGGSDHVNSGDGRDVIYYGSELDSADANDAGDDGGDARGDLLVIQGDYSGGVTLGADALVDVEKFRIQKGSFTGWGDTAGNHYSYEITSVDANVAAGGRVVVQGGSLQLGEHLTFDGSAETDGSFQMFGGHDSDTLIGGAQGDHLLGRSGDDTLTGNGGDDRFRGGLGADTLDGGAGSDTFTYAAQGGDEAYSNPALESTSLGYDTIIGFNFAQDRIDLPQTVSSLAKVTSGTLSNASFDSDLASAVDASLASHGAVLFTASSGGHAGDTFLIVDADGDGSYQANADYVIHLLNPVGTAPSSPDFLL